MKTNSFAAGPSTVIGIDLGDKKHAFCVLDQAGKILREDSIPNRASTLIELAQDHAGSTIAMEAGTHSPWISRLLESHGLEVLVANPRKLRAIYRNERKCDRVDAEMLARMARFDPSLLYPICHSSEQAQRDLLAIKMRDTLVRQRVRAIASLRDMLKSLGVRLPSANSAAFSARVRAHLEGGDELGVLEIAEPLLTAIDATSQQIQELDKSIHRSASLHPAATRLQQINGVGPITALSFVLCVEDPERFALARQIGPWLGMVPKRDQSGGADPELPISKCGNGYLRKLLVQCAQYIMGPFGPDCDLRRYGMRIAERGGKKAKRKAVVAVARKLAVLMLTLWKNQSDYVALMNSQTPGGMAAS